MVCGSFFKKFLFFVFLFGQISLYGTIPDAYRIPESHPIKPALDSLFSSSRALLNLKTLKKAGFICSKPRKFTNLIIASHPSFPGYIFKLYVDAQRFHKDKPEEHFWTLRVQGANRIRQEIENNQWHHLMKVPQKWIYELPKKPTAPNGYMSKNYVLVEEDMELLSAEDNEKLWSSSYVTEEHLEAIYYMLKKVGLSDCAKPDNLPFSIDGRISFIDTQTQDRKVPYNNLTSWLSEENQEYWKLLID